MSKKVRLISIVLLVSAAIAFAYFLSGGLEKNSLDPEVTQDETETGYPYSSQLLTPAQMKEDLEQLQADLAAVHPKTETGVPQELDEAFTRAFERVKNPMTTGEFYSIVAAPPCILGDAHTTIYPLEGGLQLSADIRVVGNKLYVIEGVNFEPGDELISLGGISVERVFALAESVVSTENPYWRNYRLPTLLKYETLRQLGEFKGGQAVEAGVIRNGKNMTVIAEFSHNYAPQKQGFNKGPDPYDYRLNTEAGLCVFKLRNCISDKDFSTFLAEMFGAIASEDIQHLIVDLRGNPGGTIGVLNEFLRYINVDEYTTNGYVTRLSQAACEKKGVFALGGLINTSGPKPIKNRKVEELVYDGDIYILIDNGTFSAANLFATILVDNGLATTVGEPSGNAPSFYADILQFQLKHSKLFYTISSSKLLRPDTELEGDSDALNPDIPVECTVQDYLAGRDPAYERILTLIKQGGDEANVQK